MNTALPYLDTDIDQNPAVRSLVAQLIRDEAAACAPPAPLAASQQASPPRNSPALDTSAYDLKPPAIDAPEHVWRQAADMACVRLEYERMREDNCKLASLHAGLQWKSYVTDQEALVASLEAQLASLKAQAESVNTERREMHLSLGKRLDQAQISWSQTVYTNSALRAALEAKKQSSHNSTPPPN